MNSEDNTVSQYVISAKDVSLAYDEYVVLRNVTFDAIKGKALVVMGGSGCGKSTLLKSLIGLLEPVSGSIFSMRSSAIWNMCAPSKAVPAIAVISIERTIWPVPGSTAFNLSPEANHTFFPSWETP